MGGFEYIFLGSGLAEEKNPDPSLIRNEKKNIHILGSQA